MSGNVAVVGGSRATAITLGDQIRTVLGPQFRLLSLSQEDGLPDPIPAGLILISTPVLTPAIMSHTPPSCDIMLIRRTLTRESLARVMALPAGYRALVVNDHRDSAIETLTLLHELGARQLDLTPWHPDAGRIDGVYDGAITPGEPWLVPAGIPRVLDIGPRWVDPTTILDVFCHFGLFDDAAYRRLAAYMEQVVPRNEGLPFTLARLNSAQHHLQVVLDHIGEGVVYVDGQERIQLVNRFAEELLGGHSRQWMGLEIARAVPVLARDGVGEYHEVNGHQVMVSSVPLPPEAGIEGKVLVLKEVTEIQRLEERARRALREKGHIARHRFSDLVGRTPAFRSAVGQATRYAHSDAAVLIQGESGTGKELFAQAIHLASRRRTGPFVAINCGALSESLLESELFGYEEGAFTGARRGGKQGMFEVAHTGTLFLDEVGEIPLNTQSRLLRALQEKEVMRVGGTRVVPVDVRVVAATNRDLAAMVSAGEFRADLYYRINVLPLQIPPLRERGQDIPLLAARFLARRGEKRALPEAVAEVLQAYPWLGNIRQLENCVEYLCAVADGPITLEDLPPWLWDRGLPASTAQPAPVRGEAEATPGELSEELDMPPDHLLYILRAVADAEQRGAAIGRRTLAALAQAAGIHLTENQLRARLDRLNDRGYLSQGRGRSGTRLTDQGRRWLQGLTHRTHLTDLT